MLLEGAVYKTEIAKWRLIQKKKEMEVALNTNSLKTSSAANTHEQYVKQAMYTGDRYRHQPHTNESHHYNYSPYEHDRRAPLTNGAYLRTPRIHILLLDPHAFYHSCPIL